MDLVLKLSQQNFQEGRVHIRSVIYRVHTTIQRNSQFPESETLPGTSHMTIGRL